MKSILITTHVLLKIEVVVQAPSYKDIDRESIIKTVSKYLSNDIDDTSIKTVDTNINIYQIEEKVSNL